MIVSVWQRSFLHKQTWQGIMLNLLQCAKLYRTTVQFLLTCRYRTLFKVQFFFKVSNFDSVFLSSAPTRGCFPCAESAHTQGEAHAKAEEAAWVSDVGRLGDLLVLHEPLGIGVLHKGQSHQGRHRGVKVTDDNGLVRSQISRTREHGGPLGYQAWQQEGNLARNSQVNMEKRRFNNRETCRKESTSSTRTIHCQLAETECQLQLAEKQFDEVAEKQTS